MQANARSAYIHIFKFCIWPFSLHCLIVVYNSLNTTLVFYERCSYFPFFSFSAGRFVGSFVICDDISCFVHIIFCPLVKNFFHVKIISSGISRNQKRSISSWNVLFDWKTLPSIFMNAQILSIYNTCAPYLKLFT